MVLCAADAVTDGDRACAAGPSGALQGWTALQAASSSRVAVAGARLGRGVVGKAAAWVAEGAKGVEAYAVLAGPGRPGACAVLAPRAVGAWLVAADAPGALVAGAALGPPYWYVYRT